jgi:hypothetical protein
MRFLNCDTLNMPISHSLGLIYEKKGKKSCDTVTLKLKM